MIHFFPLTFIAGLLAASLPAHTFADAPPYGAADFVPTPDRPIGFRGDGSGHFPGATPPRTFSGKDGKNVLWSVKMPSWGQSSPIVVGKHVITMAEPDTTIGIDADTGKVLWQDALGLFSKERTGSVSLWCGNGYSWPCSDGQRAIKAWINSRGSKGGTAAAIVCYDLTTGKRLWLIEFSGDHQKHKFTREANRWAWKKFDGAAAITQHTDWAPAGYASPQMYGDTVIYQAKGAGSVVALDSKTGAQRWASKPSVFGHSGADANFLLLRVASRDLLVTNIGTVLDPRSGDVLGEAIPSVEKDGQRVSRLWGAMEITTKGEVKVAGLSPITGPGAPGVVAFGPDWPRADAAGAEGAEPSGKSPYHYLAVRLGFDAQGKLTTNCLFPQRTVVPKFEYGNAHMTILQDRLLVMPGYGRTLAAIALDTGQLVIPPKPLWPMPPQARGWGLKPDANAPDIKAGLEEFGLTIDDVTNEGRGIGRAGYNSYSRSFVDGRGYIWTMNRQAQIYRIDPTKDFAAELAGGLVHPECWTSTASPVPHGNRIYVRTFGRLACIGEK